MGANEKHEAAMHGGEYTPSTESVRQEYRNGRQFGELYSKTDFRAEFDRWLATVRAEAKAEALNEAADQVSSIDGREDHAARDWLRNRANQYKGAPSA